MGEIKRIKRANKFAQIYENLCSQKCVSPLAVVRANLAENRLRFCCDRISFEDWSPILNSLAADRSLVEIHAYSRYRWKKIHETIDTQEKVDEYRRFRGTTFRAPIIYTNFLLRCFIDAVAVCARDSTMLTSLSLDGIPLADGKYLDILCAGLAINRNLHRLSLARCTIGDEGCGILFGAILEDAWLWTIDLTACSLTSKSAVFLASFLQKKRIKLLECIWHETGTRSGVEPKGKRGLRRLVLDDNRKFGDDGLRVLAMTLKDDFWLKTLSMRRCGLTKFSEDSIKELLQTNSTILGMNLKRNKIPTEILRRVRGLLKRRRDKGERIPLKRRLLNRKKELKCTTAGASRKKLPKKRRRKTQRGVLKGKMLKSKPSESSFGKRLKLVRLNDRLSRIIDCNRNLTRGLENERRLLVSEKLSRLTAERSYQLLGPAFEKLLQRARTEDGIRGKVPLSSNLSSDLHKIFHRLECISENNTKTLGELPEKTCDAEDRGAIIDNSPANRFDEQRRTIRGMLKRPHCPPRQNI